MTVRHSILFLTLATLTLLPPVAMTAQPVEPGFTSLFNGKDLTGWVYGRRGGGENKSGKGYQVENGIIYSTKEDGGNLYTAKEYSDFIFRFDVRLNSDVRRGTPYVEGTECQLCSGLTDRLRRYYTYSFTRLHHITGRQVPAITLGATTDLRFTCKQ